MGTESIHFGGTVLRYVSGTGGTAYLVHAPVRPQPNLAQFILIYEKEIYILIIISQLFMQHRPFLPAGVGFVWNSVAENNIKEWWTLFTWLKCYNHSSHSHWIEQWLTAGASGNKPEHPSCGTLRIPQKRWFWSVWVRGSTFDHLHASGFVSSYALISCGTDDLHVFAHAITLQWIFRAFWFFCRKTSVHHRPGQFYALCPGRGNSSG